MPVKTTLKSIITIKLQYYCSTAKFPVCSLLYCGRITMKNVRNVESGTEKKPNLNRFLKRSSDRKHILNRLDTILKISATIDEKSMTSVKCLLDGPKILIC